MISNDLVVDAHDSALRLALSGRRLTALAHSAQVRERGLDLRRHGLRLIPLRSQVLVRLALSYFLALTSLHGYLARDYHVVH